MAAWGNHAVTGAPLNESVQKSTKFPFLSKFDQKRNHVEISIIAPKYIHIHIFMAKKNGSIL